MRSSAQLELVRPLSDDTSDLAQPVVDESTQPARGILIACGLSLLIWVAIAVILI
jgi:hypothetical protein